MSGAVGMLLHSALTAAGHPKWHRWDAWLDLTSDEIVVRFYSPDDKYLDFRIPSYIFDPVEYAKAKWPKWFVKHEPEQLDLFNQEQSI